jgi:hypothetical protein
VGEWLPFLIIIREISGLNLGQKARNPDWVSLTPPSNTAGISENRPRTPPAIFQNSLFTIILQLDAVQNTTDVVERVIK